MPTTLSFFKVTALPSQLTNDSLYFVQNGTKTELFITTSTGVLRPVANTGMITDIVTPLINAAIADFNVVRVVPNIAARNALSHTQNMLVLVVDATGDTTVKAGAALYLFTESANTYTKLTEYESLDVSFNWANLANKPTSSVIDIDNAVGKAHDHANKAVLDALGVVGGKLQYNGADVSTGSGSGGGNAQWATTEW